MFILFSYNYDDDNKDYTEDKDKKKKITVAGFLKFCVYIIVALILAAIIIRLSTTKDPKEAELILADHKIGTDINNLGEDFIIYKIQPPNPFAIDDAIFLANVVYLESSENLQITVRCKKNRFENILKNMESDDYINYAELVKFYLKVSTKSEISEISEKSEISHETEHTDEDEMGSTDAANETNETNNVIETENLIDYFDVSQKYVFDNERYEYIRISFDGVKIDYTNSKVELFILPEYMTVDYDPEKFLVRFIVFDLLTPKSKEKIKNFDLLN